MPTSFLLVFLPSAFADDPLDLDDDADPHAADTEPAPAPAAPAPAPSSNTPSLDALSGTWFVTSTVDGKEAVAWACKSNPTTLEIDSEAIVITQGAEPVGGAIKSAQARGNDLVLTTTLSACTGTKEMKLRWADPAHHVLEIDRCEGTPRTVHAVRDAASQVPVLRQCCDASGKALKYVGIEAPCPTGSDGPRPTPLRR